MIVIHFLLALIFVILFTGVLVVFYFYVVKFFIWFYKLVTRAKKRKLLLKSNLNKKIFLFLLAFNTIMFIQQLVYWNGKDSAYPQAKCYYAAGNVVAMYRSFVSPVLSPNNPLTFWLEIPQRIIYSSAASLIPQEDGELAVWRYEWLVYPFTQSMSMPYSIYESNWNPLFRDKGEIATVIWNFIQATEQDNFKDKKIRDEHALRDLPSAVLYMDNMYDHGKVKSTVFVTKEVEEEIAKQPIEYTEGQLYNLNHQYLSQEAKDRYREIFDKRWIRSQKSGYMATTAYKGLNKLEDKWQASEYMRKEIKKDKSLEVMRIAAMIAVLQRGAIHHKLDHLDSVSCQDPYILHYIKLREKLSEMEHQHESRLIKNLAHRYLSHITAEYLKYLFDTYCEYNLVGLYNTKFGTGKSRYTERPSILKYGSLLQKNKTQ